MNKAEIIDAAERSGIVQLFQDDGFNIEISGHGAFKWTVNSGLFEGRVVIDEGKHLGGTHPYRRITAAIEHLRTHQTATATGEGVKFTPDVDGIKQAIAWVKDALERAEQNKLTWLRPK
jgi:hypothetical protein